MLKFRAHNVPTDFPQVRGQSGQGRHRQGTHVWTPCRLTGSHSPYSLYSCRMLGEGQEHAIEVVGANVAYHVALEVLQFVA